ncbi:hypothetical protein SAMN05660666_03264 [Novosphingobium aromaticivorans]|nr:hypothetical protein SAMN05660666_03264 [Novosphingobium aromaticivorans]
MPAVVRAFQQVVLVSAAYLINTVWAGFDIDVAGGARTATTAQGEQFVETVVSQGFHH